MFHPSEPIWLEVDTVEAQNNPLRYFPLANGRYEVKPGLIPFSTDIAHHSADQQVFQIDRSFAQYHAAKRQARAENLSKYYQTCNYAESLAGAIAQFIVQRLIQEHPQHFELEPNNSGFLLNCHLTRETLTFDPDWQLQQAIAADHAIEPSCATSLDALAMQVQEDVAIVCQAEHGANWLSAIHLCFPNHWAAAEKIGQDFVTVHQPVAGMEKPPRWAAAMIDTMITRGPFVRFAWGLSTDTRLNHHPEPSVGVSPEQWQGRQFDRKHPKLYLRLERQVIWGLPHHQAALFTIRTYFRDGRTLKQNSHLRAKLVSAIASMSSESLIYKGLVESKHEILAWLNEEND